MLSKSEMIRSMLSGKKVIDIGGSGYGEPNRYEIELAEAWQCVDERFVVDISEEADLSVDFNVLPLPEIADSERFDVAVAFDILEHVENPCAVLRWVPSPVLIVQLPNVLSPIARRMERNFKEHLFNFTVITATNMLRRGGWHPTRHFYTFGKWSLFSRMINLAASVYPPYVATGLVLYCERACDTGGT